MDNLEIKKILEALLFVSDHPLSENNIKAVLGDSISNQDISLIMKEISEEYNQRNSPMELRFIAEGWQLSTKKEFSVWIKKLFKEKTILKLSNSAIETLSIVAYKQPITRSEIEEIRGVEVSGVIETLMERKLVKIAGRKETVGRPILYGTTQEFLRHFGLGHLSELPSLEELNPSEENSAEISSDVIEENTSQEISD